MVVAGIGLRNFDPAVARSFCKSPIKNDEHAEGHFPIEGLAGKCLPGSGTV